MTISAYYLIPPLPEGLEGLAEVGLDLRWSWSHATDPLWERLDSELWNLTRNPWLILQSVSSARLKTLAGDADFRKQLNEQVMAHRKNLEQPSWFLYPKHLLLQGSLIQIYQAYLRFPLILRPAISILQLRDWLSCRMHQDDPEAQRFPMQPKIPRR